MTDSTEPTIDEILEITRYNLKTSPDEIFDKGVVINAKNLIEAHIAKEVAKARIDELIGVRGWTEYEPDPKYSPAERFHIVPYTYLTKRIEELKRSKE